MTQTNDIEQKPQVELVLLKEASAPKLSKRSAGSSLQYRLWTDEKRSDVFWQIAANDGGQHSLELVPMAKIQATIAAQAGSDPFRTRLLRSTFSGRSTNNAGFLLCAMTAEGLLLASDKAHHHVVHGNWSDWLQAVLSIDGHPASINAALALAALPADTSEPMPKGKRNSRHRTSAVTEAEHADAA